MPDEPNQSIGPDPSVWKRAGNIGRPEHSRWEHPALFCQFWRHAANPDLDEPGIVS